MFASVADFFAKFADEPTSGTVAEIERKMMQDELKKKEMELQESLEREQKMRKEFEDLKTGIRKSLTERIRQSEFV